MQLTFRNMDLAAWEQQPNPTALSFTSKCCMYPEKVFVSALCQSQFLIGQIRSQGYGPIGRQPTSFKPSTESNAGVYLHMCMCVLCGFVCRYFCLPTCHFTYIHTLNQPTFLLRFNFRGVGETAANSMWPCNDQAHEEHQECLVESCR